VAISETRNFPQTVDTNTLEISQGRDVDQVSAIRVVMGSALEVNNADLTLVFSTR
jgi:hypothetical protein